MIGSYPKLPFLILPLTRLEVPGWGKLLGLFNIIGRNSDHLWVAAPERTIRGKPHGYKMTLRLSAWSPCLSYFIGRYHEDSLQLLMSVCLRPGDRFADIGANIGLITLYAPWLVGDRGRVDSFEPNPACCDIIEKHLGMNRITNIALHRCALAESRGEAFLTLFEESDAASTLAVVPADPALHISDTIPVQTEVGDVVLGCDPRPIALMKIDVEGFELSVLKGLTRTLEAFHPVVVTEVLEGQLNAAGSGREQLAAFFRGLGYMPYGLASRRLDRRLRLRLDKLGEDILAAPHYDFVWIHPASPSATLCVPYIN
jgi:FkbM family methyltransferase